MKKTTLNFLLLCSLALNSGSSPSPADSFRPGKDLALFFAVNDYDQWQDLANPVSDVELIAKDLKDLYGFETEIVRNPDRTTILTTIEKYSSKTYAADAQLLIFFSGHGDFNESTKQGYFIPKGGVKIDTFGDTYIEYESLKRRITSLPCKHIMLALDACYSGTADEGIAMRGDPGSRPGASADAQRQQYISSSLQYKSRFMLTSGAKVRTPDKSAFVAKFLEALRSQGGSDGLVNSSELFGALTTAVPRPVISSFGDHEPGAEFLFIGKNIPAGTAIVPDRPAVQTEALAVQGGLKEEIEKDMVFIEPGTYRFGITGPILPVTVNEVINGKTESKKVPGDSSFLVRLDGFYLSKFEVTQALWRKVMGGLPTELKFKGCDKCPVENVSWEDAQLFIRNLNTQTGQKYRLPTEFEWEFAGRCGNTHPDCKCAEELDLKDLGWYKSNSGDRTHPIGEKQPNRLGLYDMAGNVKEWCSSRMTDDYYRECRAAKKVVNPQGPLAGKNRVRRGGAFDSKDWQTRPTEVGWTKSDARDTDTGFRLARSK